MSAPDVNSESTTLLEANAGWALATHGRLVLTVWRDGVTVERVAAVDRAIHELLPRCGGWGYGSITIVEEQIAIGLSSETHAAALELQRKHAAQMKCSAYLVSGAGFLMATVRTLMAGIHRVSRSPHPIRTFGTADETAIWVGPHVGLTPSEVEAVMQDVRSAGRA